MPKFIVIVAFLSTLFNCTIVMGSLQNNLPLTNPKVFAGRKLKEYPELFFVKRTKHLNIFWSGKSNCSDAPSSETIPDQRNAEKVQLLLETVVEERIEKFEQFAKLNMANWESKISRKLYPVNVQIEIESPIICGGANRYNLSVYAGEGKSSIVLKDQLILESGGKLRNKEEEKGFVSIKMHEMGHLIARALGYPRFEGVDNITTGPLEEVIADFVGFVGNQNNPLIGEGISDIIDAEYCSKLKEKLDAFERTKIESLCRVHSSKAMRDLRLPLKYYDLFKFPEQHHIAGHSNALFYRVGKIVGLDVLFRSFMTQFFSMDESVFDAEIFLFVNGVLKRAASERPQFKSAVLKSMTELSWRAAAPSSHLLVKKSLVETDEVVQFEIAPQQSLLDDVFDYPVISVNLKSGMKTNFSFHYFGDFWKPKATLSKAAACSTLGFDCRCYKDGDILSVDAVYLDKHEEVRRTGPQTILMFGKDVRSGCYKFGAD